MRRSFISITIVIISSLSLALASDARINALGGNAAYWADDDQNIYLFPATINNFQLAQISGISGGSDGDYYNDPIPSGAEKALFLFGNEGSTKWGFIIDGTADKMVHMAWGNGTFGALFGIDMNSTDDGDDKLSNSTIDGSFGMNSSFGELGVGFMMLSDDNVSTESDDDIDGLGIGVNLRRNQSLWVFDEMYVSFGLVSVSIGDATASSMGLSANLFNHWELNPNTTLLFVLGFGFESSTANSGAEGADDVTGSEIPLPNAVLAIETNINDWATMRAGITNKHAFSSSTDNGTTKTSDNGASDFSALFGLGFNYGGFKLDMDLNPGFFTNPVNHITGFNIMEPLGTMATISYNW